ncbi:hypothetical protein CAMRE0001_2518 [Campylobacter rectus RM3267]|uniref:Uncharacterized protein n=1 Tax=Campylobacter rectus RM3267 TaxID=553218 RepID=B9D5F1_CAMRE|nr:hypothetical protein CAMRE0001_2518 [Campylobacter rectus RM3267]
MRNLQAIFWRFYLACKNGEEILRMPNLTLNSAQSRRSSSTSNLNKFQHVLPFPVKSANLKIRLQIYKDQMPQKVKFKRRSKNR